MSSESTTTHEFRLLLLNRIFYKKYAARVRRALGHPDRPIFPNPSPARLALIEARVSVIIEVIATSLGEELRDLLRSTPKEIQEYVHNNTHLIIEELCSPTFSFW